MSGSKRRIERLERELAADIPEVGDQDTRADLENFHRWLLGREDGRSLLAEMAEEIQVSLPETNVMNVRGSGAKKSGMLDDSKFTWQHTLEELRRQGRAEKAEQITTRWADLAKAYCAAEGPGACCPEVAP